MASFFKPVCDIEIRLDGEDARDMVEFKTGGKDRKEKAPLYKDGESVKGSVIVRPKDGKKLEHTGIKVNLIGSIGNPPLGMGLVDATEMYYDRGAHYEFVSLLQELAAPGEMRNNQAFDFEFKNVEKQYESYHGINVKLRYLSSKSCLTIATSFESQYQDGWPMLFGRKISGCIHSSRLSNQTVP